MYRVSRHTVFFLAALVQAVATPAQAGPEIAGSWEIGEVPAGFPVQFCLLTAGERQYVACSMARGSAKVGLIENILKDAS